MGAELHDGYGRQGNLSQRNLCVQRIQVNRNFRRFASPYLCSTCPLNKWSRTSRSRLAIVCNWTSIRIKMKARKIPKPIHAPDEMSAMAVKIIRLERRNTVTGQEIFRTGRLIAVGPLTTTPGIPVRVKTAEELHPDRRGCTCIFCCSLYTQSQNAPVSPPEADIQSDRHVHQETSQCD
jgi:hypothetical protein